MVLCRGLCFKYILEYRQKSVDPQRPALRHCLGISIVGWMKIVMIRNDTYEPTIKLYASCGFAHRVSHQYARGM